MKERKKRRVEETHRDVDTYSTVIRKKIYILPPKYNI